MLACNGITVAHLVSVHAQGLLVEDFDGAVQSQLTIVQPCCPLHNSTRPPVQQHSLETVWEEDTIRVNLNDPVVPPDLGIQTNLLPEAAEHLGVHRCVGGPANGGMQGAWHKARVEGLSISLVPELDALVGVDSPLVARKDAHPTEELRLEQGFLVGPPQHQRATEEGRPLRSPAFLLLLHGDARHALQDEMLVGLGRPRVTVCKDYATPDFGATPFASQTLTLAKVPLEHASIAVREFEQLFAR
mmetsp:Transcript_73103/g.169501  ORF Transcript_73103/g.169501 Transcript_73103/m.169501 type:complete len:245 (+) Transcript_73103:715-1449(+)